MLELAVEATYPVDETIISALLAMSSAIQGVIMLEMKTVLRKTIPTNELVVFSFINFTFILINLLQRLGLW